MEVEGVLSGFVTDIDGASEGASEGIEPLQPYLNPASSSEDSEYKPPTKQPLKESKSQWLDFTFNFYLLAEKKFISDCGALL